MQGKVGDPLTVASSMPWMEMFIPVEIVLRIDVGFPLLYQRSVFIPGQTDLTYQTPCRAFAVSTSRATNSTADFHKGSRVISDVFHLTWQMP